VIASGWFFQSPIPTHYFRDLTCGYIAGLMLDWRLRTTETRHSQRNPARHS